MEVGASVVRHLHAAVRAREDPLAVFRVDPVRLVVAVHVVGDAVEGPASVGRFRQPARERVQRLVVGGVDVDVGVVEGPEVELVLVVVDHLPGLAVVVGHEERAGGGVFGDQVDDVRTRLRHADADAGHGLVRRRRDLLPRDAAVARDVKRRLPATVVKTPRQAAEGPHAGVDVAGVRQVDVDVRAPRVLVDEQHVVPGPATVGRTEDAALPVGAPFVAHRADQGDIGVARVDDDALDAFAVVEAEVGPGGAAIGRTVHAVTVRDRVARVALAGAEPYDVVVGGGKRQRPDRVGVLVVPLMLEGHAAVGRLPDTPVGRSDPEGPRIARHAHDGGHPSAHVHGTDVSPLDVAQRSRDGGGALGLGRCGGENGEECEGEPECAARRLHESSPGMVWWRGEIPSGSRKFNGRRGIRTPDLLLVRITGGPTFYGENSTKFNQDCTICRSRRSHRSDFIVLV